jgi:two-component system, cell cycle sensor histidine kinase and response regulator CckA
MRRRYIGSSAKQHRARAALARAYQATVRQKDELSAALQSAREELRRIGAEREQAEAALRESEERFAILSQATFEGIGLSDAGRVIDANDQLAKMLGYEPGELIGTQVLRMVAPESRDLVIGHMRAGHEAPYEHLALRKDGSVFPVEVRARALPYKGRIVRVAAVRDIAERRQTEAALRRYAARMESLHEIDRAILSERSPEAIAQAALGHIRRLVPSVRASVAIFDQPDQQARILAVSAGDATYLTPDERVPLEYFGDLADLQHGRPYCANDLSALVDHVTVARRLVAEGVRAALMMPLIANGELIGALNLEAGAPGAFGAEYTEITRQVADQLAIAIQQARLLAQTTDTLAREQRLNEIARTLSESLDLNTLIPSVVRLAAELVGAEAGALSILSADGQMLALPYYFNYPGELSRDSVPREYGGLAWHIVTTGAPLLLDDYNAHPAAQQGQTWIKGFLGVPVVAGGMVLGALFLINTDLHKRFSARDLALVESIGRQAGVAIQNARLFAAEQRRVALLTAIYDIGLDVSGQLDLPALLQTLVERAVELLHGQFGGLYLLEPDGQTLDLVASLPLSYKGNKRRLGEGMAGKVAQSGKPLIITNYREWPERVALYASEPFRSVAGVPIVWQGSVIGVIDVIDEQPNRFDAGDIETLRLLAAQAAVAIQNAQLYYAAQHAAQRKDEALALLDTLLASAPIGMAFLDRDLRYVRVNDAFAAINSVAPEAHLGRTLHEVLPELAPTLEPLMRRVLATGEPSGELELSGMTAAARSRQHQWLVRYYPVRNQDTQILGVGAIVMDITERKRLEAQLLQAQKMESVGQLAGGIAHDFNNLLTAIAGYAEMARDSLPSDDLIRQDLVEILKAAGRATSLTRQLLAFARKQNIEPHALNLNDLILEIDKLLRRLIGEDIELVMLPAPDLGMVKADPGQIEQVLINLAVNARHAMPGGGKLTIETRNVVLDEDETRQYIGLTPGTYIFLAISDTGVGMDRETQAHLFEPFFTTKGPGRGTGLGLATCYGIVQQHGGHISAYSELGHGTTFKIYLPRAADAAVVAPLRDETRELPRGSEFVLVAEDEPAVRAMAARILRQQGYRVLEAANGDEALRIVREQHEPPIALLLTDMVMPQMGGKLLAEQIGQLRPAIRVLFMSGYTDTAIVQNSQAQPKSAFLQKPFSPATLARKVREVLDA